ncbi:TetR/AcrR family transcriptional regulator [Hyphomonas sp.]|uniref:TetR/AcrR family transcriptional regulator n=1 Tax=Hyphomonas sp. TaxID=87 RepID=UPI0035273898
MVRLQEKNESDAVDALKHAALKLFAKRGVDGVTVREIAAAAGQKNHGAVGYHFGSKAELIRTIVVDGARLIDERRNQALDELAASGRPPELDDVIRVLVFPSIDLAPPGEEECYNRFVVLFAMAHRDLFMSALENRWNTGYQRCIDLLRGWMNHLPKRDQTERIVFIEAYLGGVLSARETRLADSSRAHSTWSTTRVLEHFVQTIAAIVKAPALA